MNISEVTECRCCHCPNLVKIHDITDKLFINICPTCFHGQTSYVGENLYPTEFNLEDAKYFNSLMKDEGGVLYYNDLDPKTVKDDIKTYNNISIYDYFDHQHNILDTLLNLKSLLNPSGKIYVQVMDSDILYKDNIKETRLNRINYFNVLSMGAIVSEAGLCIQDVMKSNICGGSYIFILSDSFKHGDFATQLNFEKSSGKYNLESYTK